MAKPLAGKRAFEAMGRRARSHGTSILIGRAARNAWPQWARSAWTAGWINQAGRRAQDGQKSEGA